MSAALAVAVVLLVALNLYVITGGADFGGGVWDLFAGGRRAARQRELIAKAIGPIWEANHVWLILVIVLLFVCFPPAFVLLTVALHVPLLLMLLGIVLRGSAFVFRAHDSRRDTVQRRWSRVFAVASLLTPLTFGMCVGVVASGSLRAETSAWPATLDVLGPWTRPFPIAVGLLTVALFAFLAAAYLIHETEDPELKEDFRARALISGVATAVLAAAALALAQTGAPRLHARLLAWPGPLLVLLPAGVATLVALARLFTRRFRFVRTSAAAFATVLLWGWAWGQYPRLIEPDLGIAEAAHPAREVLGTVLVGLAVGAVVLVPSLVYLFRVFKTRPRESEHGSAGVDDGARGSG